MAEHSFNSEVYKQVERHSFVISATFIKYTDNFACIYKLLW